MSDEALTPLVRVEDATLVADGGPARLVVSRLERMPEVADAAASAGGVTELLEDRMRVTIVPSRLVDAAGRTGGAELADPLREAVEGAINHWSEPPPDIETPSGSLPCSERPLVMGIVNVTPDSFSDGGTYYDPDDHPGAVVEHARKLIADGADIVDVGGESTRPGADPVGDDEELERVIPVIEALADEPVVLSVDTRKARVAREAVGAGAQMVNDVSGGRDGLMIETVRELDVPYILMHMRGTPRTMQRDPRYADVVAEVFDFLAENVERLRLQGLGRRHLIIDPGIGFGKTTDHNVEILRRVREFTSLGAPVLIGTSRKSFLGNLSDGDNAEPTDRLEASVASAAYAVSQRVSIVRVHDVAETARAIPVATALRN
ncbi:MAG: dihydropteroate synthase [Nitriliruptorales bacterium]|nr:dihydropteroate synthase [Nitriliruptorales bacterium]